MTPPKTACHKPYMQKFKRGQNEQILFLHETTLFDLLNSTLSYSKMNGYLISGKQTNISNIKSRKNMSQGFCNLRDATEHCPNLYSGFSYCRPNCAYLIAEYAFYLDSI